VQTLPLNQGVSSPQLREAFLALDKVGYATMRKEGALEPDVTVRRSIDMRYKGQSFELAVDLDLELEGDLVLEAVQNFHESHERTYGHGVRGNPVEFVNVRSVYVGPTPKALPNHLQGEGFPAGELGDSTRTVYFGPDRGRVEVSVVPSGRLSAGMRLEGPVIVDFSHTTLVVTPNYAGCVDDYGNIVLTLNRLGASGDGSRVDDSAGARLKEDSQPSKGLTG